MTSVNDRDLERLGDELRSAPPSAPDVDRVRGRGRVIRRRRRVTSSAIGVALVVLVAVPVVRVLPGADVDDVDFADTSPAAPDETTSETIDSALLPDAVLAVLGPQPTDMGETADYGLIKLDGSPHRAMPVFSDPGEVLGLDVATSAAHDDFTIAWRLANDATDGRCQVALGRDATNTVGFGATANANSECPSGMALSPDADVLAWTVTTDGVVHLEWQDVEPAPADVPAETTVIPDERGPMFETTSGSAGKPSLAGEPTSVALQGLPAEVALDDWVPAPDGVTLLFFRGPGGAWEALASRAGDAPLGVAAPTPVPPSPSGFIVIDRAPAGRGTATRSCMPTCRDATVLLVQDPADGSIHVELPGDTPLQVGPAGSDASSWYVDALGEAVVVGDGTQAWLLARGVGGWQGPQPLPGETRQALFVPATASPAWSPSGTSPEGMPALTPEPPSPADATAPDDCLWITVEPDGTTTEEYVPTDRADRPCDTELSQ